MRRSRFSLLAFAAAILMAGVLATPARATDDDLSYARIVRLSYATGDVQIVRAGDAEKWEPAFANMPIQQGFTIGTNNGAAEIEFEHGSALWLASNSTLQFTELALSDGGRITKMTLARGKATFEAGLQVGDVFEVSTSQFQITPTGKSQFRVDAFTAGGSVSVLSGRVSVSGASGAQEVAKGETLTLNAEGPTNASIKRSPASDNWDRWVNNRENYLVNGATQTEQYTNSPYSYGSADLSSYGNWSYAPGCGYGWQPYGVSAGWMPFYNGQWMNYSGLGWTWVSFEPWGWMPYHFGGWSNCGGAGWMWMPGENGFWNPGAVQWVGVGKRIGWRPLPPRVNAPHPAASPVVTATKSLTKEGAYEVVSAIKAANNTREFSGAPLADGKMPVAGVQAGGGSGAGRVVVPTAASLSTLRSSMNTGGASARAILNAAPPSNVPSAPATRGATPGIRAMNAAPAPPARMPSAPPVRTFTSSPSQPGQASARASSSESGRGWSGASASSGASRGSSGSSASSGASASSGGASRGGGAGASSGSSGGGGRPHQAL